MCQYILLQRLLGFLGLLATCGVAALLYGITVVDDMKSILKSTNDNAIAGDQPNTLQAIDMLNEFIELHAMIKELSVTHFNDIFSC